MASRITKWFRETQWQLRLFKVWRTAFHSRVVIKIIFQGKCLIVIVEVTLGWIHLDNLLLGNSRVGRSIISSNSYKTLEG